MTLTKDDLRFKIMRKSSLNKGQSSGLNGGDLRDFLSRHAQSSTTSLGTQQRMPQVKDARKHFPDLRDGRQQMQEPRDARLFVPESRDGRRRLSEPREGRERLPEHRDGRYVMPDRKDVRDHRLGSNSSSFPGRIPSSRSTDALPHLDSLKSSYSPWTLDSLRQGSSHSVAGTSRGFSPPRRNEELERRPLVRAYDNSRMSSYMSKDAFEHSRPVSSAPYPVKTAQIAGPARSMGPPLAPLPSSAALVQKSSYTVQTTELLCSLSVQEFS